MPSAEAALELSETMALQFMYRVSSTPAPRTFALATAFSIAVTISAMFMVQPVVMSASVGLPPSSRAMPLTSSMVLPVT